MKDQLALVRFTQRRIGDHFRKSCLCPILPNFEWASECACNESLFSAKYGKKFASRAQVTCKFVT